MSKEKLTELSITRQPSILQNLKIKASQIESCYALKNKINELIYFVEIGKLKCGNQ